MKSLAYSVSAAALASGVALIGATAHAANQIDTSGLRAAVTVNGVRLHQQAFQDVADVNGGVRASGTPGYDASVDYVLNQLDGTYFDVATQDFVFRRFEIVGSPVFAQTAPGAVVYIGGVDFDVATYSGAGLLSGVDVTAVDLDLGLGNASTSGCESDDFAGFTAGNVALVQRGACSFQLKAANAEAAGASGVIIFNQGDTADRQGLLFATLGEDSPVTIPVVTSDYFLGETLAGLVGLQVDIDVDVVNQLTTTWNVLAETAGGRDDRVVVVGAHLDSVSEGPGIQDNGSGSAAILEIAVQMAAAGIAPRNKVRFAWWGAEEAGLVGSQHYVDNLSVRDVKNIAVNLNFDMIGSPNFVRFVYDGDGGATGTAGPNGSANAEDIFLDYFADQGLATEPTEFDGRSDYGPFIAVGIPAGGLFTGAEGIKSPEEAAIYGGTAGDQYDPCYHLACDTFDNISLQALDEMSDAAAHAVLTFAMTTSSVNGTAKASDKATKSLDDFEFLGSRAQR